MGCFVQKYVFIVAMVTVLSLDLHVSGGLCPDQNGKTVISRKKFAIYCKTRNVCERLISPISRGEQNRKHL